MDLTNDDNDMPDAAPEGRSQPSAVEVAWRKGEDAKEKAKKQPQKTIRVNVSAMTPANSELTTKAKEILMTLPTIRTAIEIRKGTFKCEQCGYEGSKQNLSDQKNMHFSACQPAPNNGYSGDRCVKNLLQPDIKKETEETKEKRATKKKSIKKKKQTLDERYGVATKCTGCDVIINHTDGTQHHCPEKDKLLAKYDDFMKNKREVVYIILMGMFPVGYDLNKEAHRCCVINILYTIKELWQGKDTPQYAAHMAKRLAETVAWLLTGEGQYTDARYKDILQSLDLGTCRSVDEWIAHLIKKHEDNFERLVSRLTFVVGRVVETRLSRELDYEEFDQKKDKLTRLDAIKSATTALTKPVPQDDDRRVVASVLREAQAHLNINDKEQVKAHFRRLVACNLLDDAKRLAAKIKADKEEREKKQLEEKRKRETPQERWQRWLSSEPATLTESELDSVVDRLLFSQVAVPFQAEIDRRRTAKNEKRKRLLRSDPGTLSDEDLEFITKEIAINVLTPNKDTLAERFGAEKRKRAKREEPHASSDSESQSKRAKIDADEEYMKTRPRAPLLFIKDDKTRLCDQCRKRVYVKQCHGCKENLCKSCCQGASCHFCASGMKLVMV